MYIGIDIGTSSIKCVLIDDNTQVVGIQSAGLSVLSPQPLWSEQNPEDWWHATKRTLKDLSLQFPEECSQIKAIGLSGQMHGATLLDQHEKILRPAILWNDGRSHEECRDLTNNTDALRITGNLVMPAFTAPKLLWVKNNEADIFKRVSKVLLPKDYIRLKLSGDFASDMSDSSGTSWLNTAQRCWSHEMLDACGLTEDHMPKLYEGTDTTGELKKELAAIWGMPSGVKIIAGAGDNAASAISLNAINSGGAFLSLGTSGVYGVTSNQYHSNPQRAVHTYCHCVPNRWQQMTVHLSSASCLSWGAKLLNLNNVDALIEKSRSIDHTEVIFLPYLSGERTPHNNPHAKGIFYGMTTQTTDADLALAILEGVAFSLAEGQQALNEAGVQVDKLAVIGGGGKSLYWGEIIASALSTNLHYYKDRAIGAAFGAAGLAFLACNPTATLKEPALDVLVKPNEEKQHKYSRKKDLFHKLYTSLKPLFEDY